MPKNEQDPAASTQQFRAFANSGEKASQGSNNTGLIIGLAVVAVIVVVAVIALLM